MKWGNWYQNDVENDEEIKGVDYRDKMNHNEKSENLFLDMMSVAEEE